MSEQRIESLESGMKRRAVCLVYTEGCTDGIIVCDTEETANGFIRMEQESGLAPSLKIKGVCVRGFQLYIFGWLIYIDFNRQCKDCDAPF